MTVSWLEQISEMPRAIPLARLSGVVLGNPETVKLTASNRVQVCLGSSKQV